MGKPCSYRIKVIQENVRTLNIDDFNQHWWLVQPDGMAPISPPMTLDLADLVSRMQQEHSTLLPHQQQLYINSVKEFLDQGSQLKNPEKARSRGRSTISTTRNPSSVKLVEQKTMQLKTKQ